MCRSIRKWWAALPDNRRHLVREWAWLHRWHLTAGLAFAVVIAALLLLTHLDESPLTGRIRLLVFSRENYMELAALTSEAVSEGEFEGVEKVSRVTFFCIFIYDIFHFHVGAVSDKMYIIKLVKIKANYLVANYNCTVKLPPRPVGFLVTVLSLLSPVNKYYIFDTILLIIHLKMHTRQKTWCVIN